MAFPRLQRPVVAAKGVKNYVLFVVVLARGTKGIPHLVACLKRTGSGTFHDPGIVAYQNLGSIE